MSNFDNSQWSNSSFTQEYREQADDYIPERRRLIEIAQSLYDHFVKDGLHRRVLDLGCGDGLMIQELLKVDRDMDATLVDGRVSRPAELHRQPLAEPYVSVTTHTAPIS